MADMDDNFHTDTSKLEQAYRRLLASLAKYRAELARLKAMALQELPATRKRRRRKKKH